MKKRKTRTKKVSQATQDEMFRARLLSLEASEAFTTDAKDADIQRLAATKEECQ